MPKKGPDIEKIRLIRCVLRQTPKGLWVREIARRTKLDKSTVSRYLTEYMSDDVEATGPDVLGDMIKIVKLKK